VLALVAIELQFAMAAPERAINVVKDHPYHQRSEKWEWLQITAPHRSTSGLSHVISSHVTPSIPSILPCTLIHRRASWSPQTWSPFYETALLRPIRFGFLGPTVFNKLFQIRMSHPSAIPSLPFPLLTYIHIHIPNFSGRPIYLLLPRSSEDLY
jgi:hypothetical protein